MVREQLGKEGAMEWYLMVWRKFAQFDGRSRRKEYWMFTLFNILAIFASGSACNGVEQFSQYRERMSREQHDSSVYSDSASTYWPLSFPVWPPPRAAFTTSARAAGCFSCLIALGIIPVVGFITAIIQIVIPVPGQPTREPISTDPIRSFPNRQPMIYAGIPPGHSRR